MAQGSHTQGRRERGEAVIFTGTPGLKMGSKFTSFCEVNMGPGKRQNKMVGARLKVLPGPVHPLYGPGLHLNNNRYNTCIILNPQ